jgi:hypothetical protein
MTALGVAIAVVALLVVLTAVWSWRSDDGDTGQLRRRRELRHEREEERDSF